MITFKIVVIVVIFKRAVIIASFRKVVIVKLAGAALSRSFQIVWVAHHFLVLPFSSFTGIFWRDHLGVFDSIAPSGLDMLRSTWRHSHRILHSTRKMLPGVMSRPLKVSTSNSLLSTLLHFYTNLPLASVEMETY